MTSTANQTLGIVLAGQPDKLNSMTNDLDPARPTASDRRRCTLYYVRRRTAAPFSHSDRG